MSQEVLSPGTRTLEELAQTVNDNQEQIRDHLTTALDLAIQSGLALMEARDRFKDENGWYAWFDANITSLSIRQASDYIRLAHYRDVLADGPREASRAVYTALTYLRQLGKPPARQHLAGAERKLDYEECRRLRDSGMEKKDIAKLFGVHPTALNYALKTEKQREAVRSRQKARQREKSRAWVASKSKTRAGSVDKAYSNLRISLDVLQKALNECESAESRWHLEAAMRSMHKAEDQLVSAIRKWHNERA